MRIFVVENWRIRKNLSFFSKSFPFTPVFLRTLSPKSTFSHYRLRMKRFWCILLFGCCAAPVLAQQDPQYTQHMFNKQVVNPAFVGAPGALHLTFAGRSQWVGIDGHPNTGNFSINAPVPVLRGGVGGFVVRDVIGPIATTTLKLQYAFRLAFGEMPIDGEDRRMALHIGISPGFFAKGIDGTNFRPQDYSDNRLQGLLGQEVSATSFDLGAGIYFHKPAQNDKENGEKFWVGVAMDHLTEPRLKYGAAEDFTVFRYLSAMAGYRFDIKNVSLVPSLLFKMAGAQRQLDMNLNVHIRPMVFGLGFRRFTENNDGIMGILGFHATQGLFIGYSYDYTLSELTAATSGSHELVVNYTFPRTFKFRPPTLDVKEHPNVR
jgi:type IX secretion system PorP/SprF family membrane protein